MYTYEYNSPNTMSTILTVRISEDTKDHLDELAKATGRSKSFLAAEAIQRYIDTETWQIKKIKNAIKKADQGLFAKEARVKKVFEKWLKN